VAWRLWKEYWILVRRTYILLVVFFHKINVLVLGNFASSSLLLNSIWEIITLIVPLYMSRHRLCFEGFIVLFLIDLPTLVIEAALSHL